MKTLALILILVISASYAFGQQINNPTIRKSEVPYCKVTRISISNDKTIVEFNYVAPDTYINGGWICVGDNFFIRDNETGKKFFLTIANKIPICPQKHNFSSQGESLQFNLEFQPIPKTCKEIDIVENLTGGGFNFYGVNLVNTNTSANHDEEIISKANSISYNLTLTFEGKLKNKGDALGDVLYNIPSGTSVGIYSKNDGYYKVNHNGNIGYLSELYFQENNSTTASSSKINNNSQQKECKSFYRDGKTFQYYVHNGISVTMHLSIERTYGKYYIAYVSIENLTGKSFNFDPTNIKAFMIDSGTETYGDVLSANEYMNKVKNRQAWNAALVAFGESSAANQAGYSSSTSTSTTSGYSNSYGSASGYYGNTYGSVSGSSRTYGSATTRSNTQSYNGAANYAAQQNAQQNINNYQNQQYQIRNVLNQGYLKLNTIDNEQRIVGQINIKYKSANKIKVIVPVNGINYDFWWNNN